MKTVNDVLDSPLVAAYLDDLDLSLASSPVSERNEIRQAIIEHIQQATCDDSSSANIEKVLAALGPVDFADPLAPQMCDGNEQATQSESLFFARSGFDPVSLLFLVASFIALWTSLWFPSVGLSLALVVTILILTLCRENLKQNRGYLISLVAALAGLLLGTAILLFLTPAATETIRSTLSS